MAAHAPAADLDSLDDRRVMGRVSGVLWLVAAGVAAVGQALPGVPHDHPWLIWGMIVALALYGAGCLTNWIPWDGAPIWAHLAAIIAFQPVIALGLWLSGGVNSYIVPILVLALLYAAYFLPGWTAWLGVGALAVTYASTLLYTDPDEDLALARVFAFAIACAGLTLTLQALKRRLVAAERAQRRMAHADPLTGLANRRGFDLALERAIAAAGAPERARRARDPDRVALLLIDVDDFKGINDGYGHRAGDAVLRALADGLRSAVRPQDCAARFGGDELAIVAVGAGQDGARRLADAVRSAAATVRPAADAPAISVTITWAVFPDDGGDAEGLFAVVDAALHDGKRARRSGREGR